MKNSVPVPVWQIVAALEREAQGEGDARWLAAQHLRRISDWHDRTLMCQVQDAPDVTHTQGERLMKVPALDLMLTGKPGDPGMPRAVKLDGHEIPGVRSVTLKGNPDDVAYVVLEVIIGDVTITRLEEKG